MRGFILAMSLSIPGMAGADDCHYRWLFPLQNWDLLPGDKGLEADSLNSPHPDEWLLSGQATLSQNDRQLRADVIRYFRDSRQVHAFGNISLQDADFLAQTERLTHDEPSQTSELTDLRFQLRQNKAWGTAEFARVASDKRIIELHDLNYTGCPIGQESWWIHFDRLTVDDVQQTATGENALLKFYDVPVFYLPKFKFSTADRASGLLMPSFSAYRTANESRSSTKGVLKVPYYFVLAPHLDDTLTLYHMADRGPVIDNEFRYWQPWQKGELQTAWMRDQVSQQERYRIDWQASQRLPDNWGMAWRWHDVSDPNFYREIQLDSFWRRQLFLTRNLDVTKGWSDSSLTMQLLDFQHLIYGMPYYSALPRLRYRWRSPQQDGLYTAFRSELTRFALPEGGIGPIGNRLHLAPAAGFSIIRPYGFVRGQAQLLLTQYDLQDAPDNSLSRVLPLSSLDAGLTFEKPLSLLGRGFVHTLEPRAKYLYVPKQDQSQYPTFDTMARSFDYQQLFADNRFTGLDRIADANQLTTGLFSRLLHEDGRDFLELGAGQISYFQSRQVQLPGTPEEIGDFSDLVVTAALNEGPWRASITQQLDRNNKQIKQEDLSLQWFGAQDDRLLLRHRLRRKGLATEDEQLMLGGSLNYPGPWRSMHYINYNHTSDQLRSATNAVEYDACCWASQLIWEHEEYINGVPNDIIRLAFIFKGLTTFGKPADSRVDNRLYFE